MKKNATIFDLTDEERSLIADAPFTDKKLLPFKLAHLSVERRSFLLNQITGKEIAAKRFPSWYAHPSVLYPPKLHLEQSTSESVAHFHRSLYQGSSLIDVTGGFGVDAFIAALAPMQVHHLEPNKPLQALAFHNAKAMQLPHFTSQCTTVEEWLTSSNTYYDTLFIDPSRRDNEGKRSYALEHHQPNILELQDSLLKRCSKMIVKASPMLDLTFLPSLFPSLNRVSVVSLGFECKEVLLEILAVETKSSCRLRLIELDSKQRFDMELDWNLPEKNVTYSDVQSFLYEPNPVFMKSGTWNELARRFQLCKLDKETHLFTSTILYPSFPGRILAVEGVVPYQKKATRKISFLRKAHVVPKNFPDPEPAIRKKLGIAQGNTNWVYACRVQGKPVLVYGTLSYGVGE